MQIDWGTVRPRQGPLEAQVLVVLGERGIAAHAEDVERIVQDGRLPLTVLMIERRGRDIAMVCTVTALEAATIH